MRFGQKLTPAEVSTSWVMMAQLCAPSGQNQMKGTEEMPWALIQRINTFSENCFDCTIYRPLRKWNATPATQANPLEMFSYRDRHPWTQEIVSISYCRLEDAQRQQRAVIDRIAFAAQIIHDFGQIERKLDCSLIDFDGVANIEDRAGQVARGRHRMALPVTERATAKPEETRICRSLSHQFDLGKLLRTFVIINERLTWRIFPFVRGCIESGRIGGDCWTVRDSQFRVDCARRVGRLSYSSHCAAKLV